METYFQIHYEFDREAVHAAVSRALESAGSAYICVADGNILAMVQRDREYGEVVRRSLFSLCDSNWVPLYLRVLYGLRRKAYCGARIFRDIVSEGRYRMAFLGTDDRTLNELKEAIIPWNPDVADMPFTALPFCDVDKFDYPAIARQLNSQQVDIVWVALGAPKQEQFMSRLQPWLRRGVMLGVGAVFNYYSGRIRRAPGWMVACRLEFAYRLFTEPKKQWRRCAGILANLPLIFRGEMIRKRIARLRKKLQAMEHSGEAPLREETVTALGMSSAGLDSLLEEFAARPATLFTVISDDTRLWKLSSNVNVILVSCGQCGPHSLNR